MYSYTLKNGRRKWGYSADLGKPYWDGEGEKRRKIRPQVRKEGFDTRGEARAALQELTHQRKAGISTRLADRRLTTGQWADKWLASRASIRPSTRAAYRHVLDSYVKPAIGDVPLVQLRPDDLDQMLALIRDGKIRPEINRRGERPLAESAVKQIYVITAAMLAAAVRKRLIPFSPAVGAEFAEQPARPEPPIWSPAEVGRFLAFAGQEEPAPVIGYQIGATFGLRRGELCGLRWSDIDTGEGPLHVRQQIVHVGGELLTGPPKTAKGTRFIPLRVSLGFEAALREHRKRQLAARMAAESWTETGLVLAREYGSPVPPWLLSARFRELVTASGLPELTLHGLRKTANSTWQRMGIGTLTRQRWMGHSDAKMTDQTYLAIPREEHDRAAGQAADWWAANGLPGGIR